jgi:hypothetical protein
MSATTNGTEIDLTTYEAKPGTLIKALLIQTIIDHINQLGHDVQQLQQDVTVPSEAAGDAPPVILNIFSTTGGRDGPNMHVDPSADSTTIQGVGLESWALVRLDSIGLDGSVISYAKETDGSETLTATALPRVQPGTPGYFQTKLSTDTIGLLAVTTTSGTGARIVIIDTPAPAPGRRLAS